MRIAADGTSAIARTGLVETQPPKNAPAEVAQDAQRSSGPVSLPSPTPRQQQVGDDAARAQLANDLRSQRQLIDQAEAKAQQTGNPELKATADRLRSEYDALQKSKLAADVYHFDNIEGAKPPVGWTRASSLSDAQLAQYGLSRADLNPGQDATGFRAELYLPDKSVFGADARPVLAFRGSTSDLRDWMANGKQGLGQQTDYYDRAMSAAMKLNAATGGDFEITGHSLGGGLASAASAVTGAKTTTFNAAGLHDATAERFLAAFGQKPADTSKSVTGYQVQGELLTSLQESVHDVSPSGARAIADGVKGAVDIASQPLIAAQLKKQGIDPADFAFFGQAVPGDLTSLPLAAGRQQKLDAYGNDGQARPQVMPMSDMIHGLDVASRTAEPFVRLGAASGEVNGTIAQVAITGAGTVVGAGLSGTGQALQGVAAGGKAIDQGLDVAAGAVTQAGGKVNEVVSGAGEQADRAIRHAADEAGKSVADVPLVGGLLSGVTSGAGRLVGGLVDGGARLAGGVTDVGSRIVGKGLDIGGDILNGATGWGAPAGAAIEKAGSDVRQASGVAGQGAHDVLKDLGVLGGALAGGIAADGRAVAGRIDPRNLLQPGGVPAEIAKAQAAVVGDLAKVGPALGEATIRHGGPEQGADGRLSLRTVDGSLRHQIQADEQALRRMMGN